MAQADAPSGKRSAGGAARLCGVMGGDTTSAAAKPHETVSPPGSPRAGRRTSSQPPSSVCTISLESLAVADVPALEDTWTRRSGSDAEKLADWPLAAAEVAPAVEDLPPLQLAADEAGLRPVLVLGIGGTAARVLGQLRQRWSQRFENLDAMPALEMLLVDTDSQAIAGFMSGDRAAALDPDQVLLAPLGKPSDYRDAWEDHVRWLSRRWLCNIPRSQHTEGLRPLGRLALVDHAEEILARLRALIAGISAPEALAESARHAAMPVRCTAPVVILVASVSGGTGSGMALDLAYAVRKVFAEMPGPEAALCGILTHSTPRHHSERTLATLNACACL